MSLELTAREFIGTPFLHQGRNPAVGIDCIGLIVCCFRVLGWPHEQHDNPTYSRRPHQGLLEKHLQAAFGEPLPPSDAQPGDVLAMRHAGPVRHVGVVGRHPSGALTVIHTSADLGCVTEHILAGAWLRRVAGVYRPEVSLGR